MSIVRGCTGKRRFVCFSAAESSARHVRRADERSHVAPYHCQHCNGFHIGEDEARAKKKAQKA